MFEAQQQSAISSFSQRAQELLDGFLDTKRSAIDIFTTLLKDTAEECESFLQAHLDSWARFQMSARAELDGFVSVASDHVHSFIQEAVMGIEAWKATVEQSMRAKVDETLWDLSGLVKAWLDKELESREVVIAREMGKWEAAMEVKCQMFGDRMEAKLREKDDLIQALYVRIAQLEIEVASQERSTSAQSTTMALSDCSSESGKDKDVSAMDTSNMDLVREDDIEETR